MRPIQMVSKLYPQISDQIIIVGFLQIIQRFDGLDLFGSEDQTLINLPHNYIITDMNNSIDCLS
jgi:hypothetical protein